MGFSTSWWKSLSLYMHLAWQRGWVGRFGVLPPAAEHLGPCAREAHRCELILASFEGIWNIESLNPKFSIKGSKTPMSHGMLSFFTSSLSAFSHT